jgi:phospho-N-acetylmuramoyl-pentapeptide-transferase
MFYWIYELNASDPGVFRLFGSPVFRGIAALLTALIVCLLLYPWLIRQLQLKQIGQVVRDDGPESHFKKRGTPTMGGTLLVLSVIVSSLLWCNLRNPFVWLTIAIIISYAAIGFADDYLKLHRASSGGLSERWKLLSQLLSVGVVVGLFFGGIAQEVDYDMSVYFPFVKPETFAITLEPWAYAIFAAVVIFATSTACNLTDGLDGLAIGPTVVSAGTFVFLCYLAGSSIILYLGVEIVEVNGVPTEVANVKEISDYLRLPKVRGVEELAILCAAIAGAGVGFLWYNAYPAMVFMGDVGALPLGGALGAVAVFTKHEFLSVIIHGIFVIEFLSVIIQRYSFKLTGKRVFRMAPIHHHYEKKGWPESRITVRFWIISVMLALLALSSIKVR